MSRATTNPNATRGHPFIGALAAALCGAAVWKLQVGERGASAYEQRADLRHGQLEATRLVRNHACAFSHERWQLDPVGDETLGALAARAGGVPRADALRASLEVAFPNRVMATSTVCSHCGHAGRGSDAWQLAFAHAPQLTPCPQCGAARRANGFVQRDRTSVSALPPSWLARRPSELGLWPGDVIEFSDRDGSRIHFELAPGGRRVSERRPEAGGRRWPFAAVVLVGLGNVGSFCAPVLARIPGLERLVLVDFDSYEPGQHRTQHAAASDAGRTKVEATAERIRATVPGLEVREFAGPLEALPLGELDDAIAVGALDSLAARVRLAERAWRAGATLVDAGVDSDALQARVEVYAPGAEHDEAPCLECAFDPDAYQHIESVHPCDEARDERAAATRPDPTSNAKPVSGSQETPHAQSDL